MQNLIPWIIVIIALLSLSKESNSTQSKSVINDLNFKVKTIPIEVNTHPLLSSCVLNNEETTQRAKAITVKIYAGNTSGSGIIIKKENNIYTVITNHHVTIFAQENNYQIQTVNNQIYSATKVETVNFKDADLDLLEFKSDLNYTVAELAEITEISENKNSPVFAVGFPVKTEQNPEPEFIINQGQIIMITDQPLQGGYQIGYTNDVKKGMSGGALLNCQGQVIGINGRGTTLWGTPSFIFADGTSADETMTQQMTPLSWAIPIQTLLNFISNDKN